MSMLINTIPTLTELSMRTILHHINGLGYIGDIEECFKRRILSACTPDKLAELEHFAFLNSKKLDTDAFWQTHCKNKLNITTKSKKTWKDTYIFAKQNSARKIMLLKKKKKQLLEAEKKEKQKKESFSYKYHCNTKSNTVYQVKIFKLGTSQF